MALAGKATTIEGVYCFWPNGWEGYRFYPCYQVPPPEQEGTRARGVWLVCDRNDNLPPEGPFFERDGWTPSYEGAAAKARELNAA